MKQVPIFNWLATFAKFLFREYLILIFPSPIVGDVSDLLKRDVNDDTTASNLESLIFIEQELAKEIDNERVHNS
ncbi:MAG: hypothetical protein KAR42_02975 [candidate division Zixibacteria bacterium]|nr:hypothetical protein [candidate division Zixibacteria bacterium]